MNNPNYIALSGAEVTRFTTGGFSTRFYMSYVTPTIFATARINQFNFDTPLTQVTVDTISANWLSVMPGMTVWIGSTAGSRDMGVYRVRKTPTSTILYLMELAVGDPGLLSVTAPRYFDDNAYVTVMLDMTIWAHLPRINYSGHVGTFFKDWDITYTNQNNTDVPGILNLGDHKFGFVDSGTSLLDHTFTPTVVVFNSATVVATAWRVDGVSAGSSVNLTYSYPAGQHLVECAKTLSTGVVLYAYRMVFAHNTSSYPPIEIEISSDDLGDDGRRMRIVPRDLSILSNLELSPLVGIWEVVDWEGQTISSAITQCVGFVESVNYRLEPANQQTSFTLISPLMMVNRLVSFSQELRVVATPTNWQEITAALAHQDFVVFYMLHYHTSILRLFDLYTVDTTRYYQPGWQITPGAAGGKLNELLNSFDMQLTCDGRGMLQIVFDPNMQSNTIRTGIPTRITLDGTNCQVVEWEHKNLPDYNQVSLVGALSGTTTPPTVHEIISYADTPGQGQNKETLGNKVAFDLQGLRERASCRLTFLNSPFASISVQLHGSLNVVDSSLKYFVQLNVSIVTGGITYTINQRCIPKQVSCNFQSNGTRVIRVTLVPETNGNGTPGMSVNKMGNDADLTALDLALPSYSDAGLVIPEFNPLGTPFGEQFAVPIFPPPDNISDDGIPGTAIPSGVLVLSRDRFISGVDPLHEGQIHAINSPDLVPFSSQNIYTAPLYGSGAANNYTEDVEILGTPTLEDAIPAIFLVQDAGVYHTSNAFGVDPDPQLITHAVGYNELRVVAGSSNSFVVASHYWGRFKIEYNFLTSDHAGDDWELTGSLPQYGSYSGGVGYISSAPGTGKRGIYQLIFDITPNLHLEKIEIDYDLTAGTGFNPAECALYDGPTGGAQLLANLTTGTNKTLVWEATTPYYHIRTHTLAVRIFTGDVGGSGDPGGSATIKKIRIWGSGAIAGDAPTNYNARLFYGYSGDLGASFTEHDVADWDDSKGIDIDKFNLGCAVFAAGKRLYRVSGGYGNTPVLITGTLTGIDGVNVPSFVHIPYRKLATQALNNDITSLMVLYGIGSLDGTQSTWAANINMNTGAIGVISNLTPTISGTRYYCNTLSSGRALTTCDENTQKILASTSHGQDALYSDDGGTTWAVITDPDGTDVHQIRYQPGTDSVFWRFMVQGSQRVIDFVGQPIDSSLVRARGGAPYS